MPSKHREMALDIAEQMRQHKFSLPFEVYAKNVPYVNLSSGELDELRVDVFAAEESGERTFRTTFQHSYKIRLGLRKKINVTSDDDVESELDKITVIVEEMLEFWKGHKPKNAHSALVSFETITPVAIAEIKSKRLAMCELVLTFNGTRFLQE